MKDDRGDDLAEVWGGFLGILDVLAHVGRDTWCSKGPRRAPVAAIYRWEATHTGKIYSPELIGVGLHALHARPVRKELGYCEGYRYGGRSRPRVIWAPL